VDLRFTRRQFARSVGTGLGAAVLHSSPIGSALARAALPPGRSEDVVQLDSNENPYGPSPKALEAMTKSQRVASRYPDASEDALVQVIAAHHKVKPEQVALGCGSGEILRVVDMAFTGPGTRVVAAEPTFEAVLHYCKLKGAEPLKVALTADYRHDLDRMLTACTEAVHLVYVCNPNNPTGTIVGGKELKRFVAQVPKQTVILVDEAYHHFVEDPSYESAVPWVDENPNLIVARTFSKVFGLAGMRLGYAIGSAENVKAMRPHLTFSNANTAVIEAARVSLSDEEHVLAQRKLNADTRTWLCQELERDRRRVIPSHTNFVMIQTGRDVAGVIAELSRRGILVGRKFPSMGDWLRVTIGTQAETATFLRAYREVVPPPSA
jgi:histidinol-phosphate aminotransferase